MIIESISIIIVKSISNKNLGYNINSFYLVIFEYAYQINILAKMIIIDFNLF